MRLKTHQRDWNDLGTMDPYWAILSYEGTQFGKWDVDDFFRTGETQIAGVMEDAQRLGHPAGRETVLDFGCGVGRLTRAFASHFNTCHGVDISESMIAQARTLNQKYPNCIFTVSAQDNLRLFADDTFDMICSVIVLQHIPQREVIMSYVAEFVRVLKPNGLLVFQLPSYIAPKYMRQRHMWLYSVLRSAGISQRLLYEKLGVYPIRMNFIAQEQVCSLLDSCQARVLDMRADMLAPPHESRTYFVTK